jgi:acyl carrier protein
MAVGVERITKTILAAFAELNEQLEAEQRIAATAETALMGKGAVLDSLHLVNLIVAVEARIDEEFGVTVTLADERAMSQKSSPFRTVTTFAEYGTMLVNEAGGA